MKNLFVILIILSFSTVSIAQKKESTYFLKNDGTEVNIKDSADFVRVVINPDSGQVKHKFEEYNKSGNQIRSGFSSSNSSTLILEDSVIAIYPTGIKKSKGFYVSGQLEGKYESFYSSGNREHECFYIKGKLNGEYKSYYGNGQLYEVRHYVNSNLKDDYKQVYLADSLGHSFLDKLGTGSFSFNEINGDKSSGQYLEGYKNGLFIEYIAKEKKTYNENYQNGKFLNGSYKTDDGEISTYTEIFQLPVFDGDFGKFLSENLKYPSLSRRKGEKGRVVLWFVVEKDGSLTDIKVVNSVSELIDEEAIRVISNSPKWKPGKLRGKLIRVSYSQPITFQFK